MKKFSSRKGNILLLGALAIGFTVGGVCTQNTFTSYPQLQAKAETTASECSIQIKAKNLSYADSIHILYAVTYDGFNENQNEIKMLFWTAPQEEYTIETAESVKPSQTFTTIGGEECIVFYSDGISARQMVDSVYCRAYAMIDGEAVYSEAEKYSVLDYVYDMREGNLTDKQATAFNGMLNYGAGMQDLLDYKTDTLANASYYTVNIQGGTLSDGFSTGRFIKDSTITFTANAPEEGKKFKCWVDETGTEISKTATISVAVTGSKTYVSVYEDEATPADMFEYSIDNGEVIIDAFIGGVADVVIPTTIEDLPVTEIANYAFAYFDELTSVVIPQGITTIGRGAFAECGNLISVKIPDSVTSVARLAFTGCTQATIYCYAESQPDGWNASWNPDECPTIWGYNADDDFELPETVVPTPSTAISISNAEELEMIAYDMTAHYILSNDIDLQNQEWTMIGDESNPFKGIFDGQGFTIYNLTISKSANNVGLFGVNEGTIKNLSISNVNITSTSKHIGSLAGKNIGNISNCNAFGTITNNNSQSYIGGLVGCAETNSTIENCLTNIDIFSNNSTSTTYSLYVGGFVGIANGNIDTQPSFINCNSIGRINIDISYTESFLNSSFSITHNLYAGGFAGISNYARYTQCYTNNLIECAIGNGRDNNTYSSYYLQSNQKHTSYVYCGGFISNSNYDNLLNCYATPEISSENKIHSPYGGYYASGSGTRYTSTIKTYSYIGGLIGSATNTTIQNTYSCYKLNASTCSSTRHGSSYYDNQTYAYSYIGGLLGYCDNSDVTNSFSVSESPNIRCESIIGNSTSTNLINKYSALIGHSNTTPKTNNNYYSADEVEDTTHGTHTNLVNLKSVIFISTTLCWDSTIWALENGKLPTFKK